MPTNPINAVRGLIAKGREACQNDNCKGCAEALLKIHDLAMDHYDQLGSEVLASIPIRYLDFVRFAKPADYKPLFDPEGIEAKLPSL